MGFSIVSWRWFIKNVKKPIKQIFPVQYLENKKLWKVESLNTGLERGFPHTWLCLLFLFLYCLFFILFWFFLFLFLSLFTYATEYKFYRNDATIFFNDITFVAIVT